MVCDLIYAIGISPTPPTLPQSTAVIKLFSNTRGLYFTADPGLFGVNNVFIVVCGRTGWTKITIQKIIRTSRSLSCDLRSL